MQLQQRAHQLIIGSWQGRHLQVMPCTHQPTYAYEKSLHPVLMHTKKPRMQATQTNMNISKHIHYYMHAYVCDDITVCCQQGTHSGCKHAVHTVHITVSLHPVLIQCILAAYTTFPYAFINPTVRPYLASIQGHHPCLINTLVLTDLHQDLLAVDRMASSVTSCCHSSAVTVIDRHDPSKARHTKQCTCLNCFIPAGALLYSASLAILSNRAHEQACRQALCTAAGTSQVADVIINCHNDVGGVLVLIVRAQQLQIVGPATSTDCTNNLLHLLHNQLITPTARPLDRHY